MKYLAKQIQNSNGFRIAEICFIGGIESDHTAPDFINELYQLPNDYISTVFGWKFTEKVDSMINDAIHATDFIELLQSQNKFGLLARVLFPQYNGLREVSNHILPTSIDYSSAQVEFIYAESIAELVHKACEKSDYIIVKAWDIHCARQGLKIQ